MVLLPTWHDSQGSIGEVSEACRLGIYVANNIAELRGWLEGKKELP
jgi:hypothetical protein